MTVASEDRRRMLVVWIELYHLHSDTEFIHTEKQMTKYATQENYPGVELKQNYHFSNGK